jgi:hypothetical protein
MVLNGRSRQAALIGFAILSYAFMCGNQPNCQSRNQLDCTDFDVTVAPGTCTLITNHCEDGQWWNLPRVDGFELCDAPTGITVDTQRVGGITTRSICASSSVGALNNEEVEYVYGRRTLFGAALVRISTTQPLTVTAAAAPGTISLGGTSQLTSSPAGGTPPYTFAWSPAGSLNASNVQNPIASPTVSTDYTVTVTDSLGATAQASTSVTVDASLIVSASPSTINPGETSVLSAVGAGGTPPYTYSWVPVETLDDPVSATPVASPSITTLYLVTLTDSVGAQVGGSVTVTVNLVVSASATPININEGESSQLSSTVQGGTPPYSYSWTPTGSLNNSTIANPIATPAVTTSYSLVVQDNVGAVAFTEVTVTVNPSGPTGPTACFQIIKDDGAIFLVASCSTGTIVQYAYDLSWEPGNPDIVDTSDFTFVPMFMPVVGTVTLTVTDNNGNTDSETLPITYP